MLYRKFANKIERYLREEPHKILLVNGARQIGKTFLIRHIGQKLFPNYVEINLKEDSEGQGLFAHVKSTDDFYLQLGAIAGNHLDQKENTLVFLDEIQSYPHILTMLKFLNQDQRYTYIASGSQLGVALSRSASVPLGSISVQQMYPLDFEEFLLAMGCGQETIDGFRSCFRAGKSLNESQHEFMLRQFRLYLLVGGMPEVVNRFLATQNIVQVRQIQREIYELYRIDASQYDNERKLMIRRIFDMIPSNMENKKKRIVAKKIEPAGRHKQFSDYAEEFEYLTQSGVALQVQAISNPRFPLIESEQKNLLKLYLNDVGLLTMLLYDININAILQDQRSVNLGAVYESVVAQELHAHGFSLHYYDNKQKGEVDFLIDDYPHLTIRPIEVKSGKDYKVHSALDRFLAVPEYGIHQATVFSNEREVVSSNGVTYQPIYYCMFYQRDGDVKDVIIPPVPVPAG